MTATSAGRSPGRGGERSLVLAAFAVSGVAWGAIAVLLPALQRSAGATDGELGLALGALALAALPVMPLAGRLADRTGPVPALQVALVASAVTLPLPALAHGLPALVLAFAVLGLTTGALDVVAATAAAEWERREQATGGRLVHLAHAGFSFGVVGGSLAVGLAREAGVGALPLLLLVGGLTAAVGARATGHRPLAVDAATCSADAPAPSGRTSRRPLLAVGAVVAASFLVEDGLQSWSALHLEVGLGTGPALAGVGTALFGLAMGAGRLAGHVLARHVSDGLLLAGGGVLAATGTLALVTAPTSGPALLGLALAGAGTSVLAPVLLAAVGRRAAPGRQGSDLATVNALGYAGFVAGPPLVGAVSGASSLPVALGALGGVALLVAVTGPLALHGSGEVRPARSVRRGTPAAAAGSR